MAEYHINLQNVNYNDQIELLSKYFSKEEIGIIIISALQKERLRETGENLENFRKARANDLKACLNKLISLTRGKDFDKDGVYADIQRGIENNKERKPRDLDKMCNERLYTCFYKLSRTMDGFTPVFFNNVVEIIKVAQPNIRDKDVKKHYDYVIDDIVRKYLNFSELKRNVA